MDGQKNFLAAELTNTLDEPKRLADLVVVAFVARMVEYLLVTRITLLSCSLMLEMLLELVAAHDEERRLKVGIILFDILLRPR